MELSGVPCAPGAGTASPTLNQENSDIFKSASEAICRMSLSWDLSDVFSRDCAGGWVLGTKTAEVKGPSEHIMSRIRIISMTDCC